MCVHRGIVPTLESLVNSIDSFKYAPSEVFWRNGCNEVGTLEEKGLEPRFLDESVANRKRCKRQHDYEADQVPSEETEQASQQPIDPLDLKSAKNLIRNVDYRRSSGDDANKNQDKTEKTAPSARHPDALQCLSRLLIKEHGENEPKDYAPKGEDLSEESLDHGCDD